ncbi:hypothetical protein D3C80_1152490 [compost metagenome]
MRRHRRVLVPFTFAQHQACSQRRHASVDVHGGATSKVQHAPVMHQGTRPAPNHVRHRRVDQGEPDRHEQQRSGELHALGKGTSNQCRSDDCESHLKGHKYAFGNITHQTIWRHACEKRSTQTADEAIEADLSLYHVSSIDHHAVAVDHPQHPDQSGDAEALREQRQHVLGPHQTAIK